ncbi:MAG: phosphatase PAP2 family protein [Gemmatimonadota bacterium]|jgi:membrane-associated phospholipid phosphatase
MQSGGTIRGHRPRWAGPLLAYLAATSPLAVFVPFAGGSGQALIVPLHLALLAWVWAVWRGGPPRRVPGAPARGVIAGLADWTFPLVLPLLYAELPLLMGALPGPVLYRDEALRRADAVLFGGQPSLDWATALPVPWVSELLHLAYLSYYALIYVPPALLWVGLAGPRDPAARRDAFDRTVLAMSLAMLAAFAVMIVWPVQGPRYVAASSAPGGPVRSVALTILEAGSSRGAAFPSSHVSLAVAQAVMALRFQRRVGVVVSVLALLLAVGAVYAGFHYLTDVVAGVALGLGAAALASSPRPLSAGETPPDERG